MTLQFKQGDVLPNWEYLMLSGLILPDGRVATLGYNPDNDTGTVPEDCWSGATLGVLNGYDHKLIPFPATPVNMALVSDNPNDTAAGTGVRSVTIGYLAAGYVAKTVTLATNGLTEVPMPEPVLRINSMINATCGTTPRGINLGNLSMRDAGGLGKTYAYMAAGVGLAQSSLFTVPTGRTFDILAILNSVHQVDTSSRAATLSLSVMNSAGRQVKGLFYGTASNSNYLHHANGCPVTSVPSTFDVWLICENVSANNTAITGALYGALR